MQLWFLIKLIEIKPDFVEAWNNKGVSLDRIGRFDDALNALDNAIELKPDYAQSWFNKGVSLGNMERFDDALNALDNAIELKPSILKHGTIKW